MSRYQDAGLATIKLMGVGFTVVDLHWSRVTNSSIMVECFTDNCRIVARVSRLSRTTTPSPTTVSGMFIKESKFQHQHEMNPFVASPSTTITTTTRQPTTTRPRGSILFFERTTTRAPSSGRSETGCRAVGRWRGRPGMDAWCSSNCRRFHCPRGVCTCESPR